MIGVTQFAKSGRTNEVRPPPPLRSAPGPPLRQHRAARPTKRSGYCLVGAPAATSRLHLPRPLRPIRPHCRQATGTAAARWRSPTMAWMDEYCRGVGGVGEGWRNKGTTGRKFVLWANWRWIAAIVYYDVAPVTHARLDVNAKRKWSHWRTLNRGLSGDVILNVNSTSPAAMHHFHFISPFISFSQNTLPLDKMPFLICNRAVCWVFHERLPEAAVALCSHKAVMCVCNISTLKLEAV